MKFKKKNTDKGKVEVEEEREGQANVKLEISHDTYAKIKQDKKLERELRKLNDRLLTNGL